MSFFNTFFDDRDVMDSTYTKKSFILHPRLPDAPVFWK